MYVYMTTSEDENGAVFTHGHVVGWCRLVRACRQSVYLNHVETLL